jgi:hypothetical protein
MADSTTISFTKSNREKSLLVRLGYIYRLKKTTTKVKYWTCQSSTCTAGIHTDKSDEFIKSTGKHRHLSAPEHVELRDPKNKVKNRILDESLSVPKVYVEELARSNLSSTALTLAPSTVEASKSFVLFYRSYSSLLYRAWLQSCPKKIDSTVAEINELRHTRCLPENTEQQLEMLFESEWIFLDRTFDACPSQFKQLYTIH